MDGSSVSAGCHHFVDTSAVVLKVLLGGEVQIENKVVHGDDANAPLSPETHNRSSSLNVKGLSLRTEVSNTTIDHRPIGYQLPETASASPVTYHPAELRTRM